MLEQKKYQIYRKREEWLEIVREGCRSILTDAQWCRSHQISYDSFCVWKSHFKKEGLLHDLYRETQLFTCSRNQIPIYALPISHRPDIKVMLCPLTRGKSPASILTQAWSQGAKRNDESTYVFADKEVKNIYLFRWEKEHFTSMTIHLDKNCRIVWPKAGANSCAVMRRTDLVNLLKTILPHIKTPLEKRAKIPGELS